MPANHSIPAAAKIIDNIPTGTSRFPSMKPAIMKTKILTGKHKKE